MFYTYFSSRRQKRTWTSVYFDTDLTTGARPACHKGARMINSVWIHRTGWANKCVLVYQICRRWGFWIIFGVLTAGQRPQLRNDRREVTYVFLGTQEMRAMDPFQRVLTAGQRPRLCITSKYPGYNCYSWVEFLELEERKMTSFPTTTCLFKDAGDEGD